MKIKKLNSDIEVIANIHIQITQIFLLVIIMSSFLRFKLPSSKYRSSTIIYVNNLISLPMCRRTYCFSIIINRFDTSFIRWRLIYY